jgi:hypothetical protein
MKSKKKGRKSRGGSRVTSPTASSTQVKVGSLYDMNALLSLPPAQQQALIEHKRNLKSRGKSSKGGRNNLRMSATSTAFGGAFGGGGARALDWLPQTSVNTPNFHSRNSQPGSLKARARNIQQGSTKNGNNHWQYSEDFNDRVRRENLEKVEIAREKKKMSELPTDIEMSDANMEDLEHGEKAIDDANDDINDIEIDDSRDDIQSDDTRSDDGDDGSRREYRNGVPIPRLNNADLLEKTVQNSRGRKGHHFAGRKMSDQQMNDVMSQMPVGDEPRETFESLGAEMGRNLGGKLNLFRRFVLITESHK